MKKRKEYPKKKVSGHIDGDTIYFSNEEDMEKYRKIVPISDEVKNKIIDTVRKEFLENGNGMSKEGGSKELSQINTAYLKNISPKERFSVVWTLAQIQINEERRLVNYVKENDPTWDYGKRFDKNILTKSNFGTNSIDVKA